MSVDVIPADKEKVVQPRIIIMSYPAWLQTADV